LIQSEISELSLADLTIFEYKSIELAKHFTINTATLKSLYPSIHHHHKIRSNYKYFAKLPSDTACTMDFYSYGVIILLPTVPPEPPGVIAHVHLPPDQLKELPNDQGVQQLLPVFY
jgi:hypothetical protein